MNSFDLTPAERDEFHVMLESGAHRITHRRRMRANAIAGAFAVLLVAAVSAGAITGSAMLGNRAHVATTPTNLSSPSVSESPTPASETPTPAPTSSGPESVAPASRFDLRCADLQPAVLAALSQPATPIADRPSIVSSQSWLPGPGQHVFEQDGALYCEFGDPLSRTQWAEIEIVADGSGPFSDRPVYDFPEGACRIDDIGICERAILAADVYVEVSIQDAGAGTDEELEASFALLVDTIAAQAAAAAGGSAEPISRTLRCEDILPPAALGPLANADLEIVRPSGGWSIEHWLLSDRWGAEPCSYTPAGSSTDYHVVGGITWLPGGAWAFDRLTADDILPLSVDAEAKTTCPPAAGHSCWVDVLVGDVWVRYFAAEFTSAGPDFRSHATAVAEEIAANLVALR